MKIKLKLKCQFSQLYLHLFPISQKKGEQLSIIFQKLKTPPEKTIGFTIVVIALGAKMTKADGIVTNEEKMERINS